MRYSCNCNAFTNALQVSLANANVLFIILYKFYVQHIYINALQVSLANALSTSSITRL